MVDSPIRQSDHDALKNLSFTEIYNQIQGAVDVVAVVKVLNYVSPTQESGYQNSSR
jgi:hypothetical protein